MFHGHYRRSGQRRLGAFGALHDCVPWYTLVTMLEVRQSAHFVAWFARLSDRRGRARIQARIERARVGNLGDTRSVGGGVSEMRIDVGPGYRLYLTLRETTLLVLLCGGDKSSQRTDIRRARALAAAL